MQYEIDRHLIEWAYDCDFTIEFDIRLPHCKTQLTKIQQEIAQYESETFTFTKQYCDEIFNAHKHLLPQAINWSFAGRSSGWFVILCNGDVSDIPDEVFSDVCGLVETYYNEYNKKMFEYYGEPI